MTKRTLDFFILVFSLCFILCAVANTNLPTPATSIQNLNTMVAVVNNKVITQTELDNAMTKAKQELAASENPNALSDTQLRQMVLQQLIDEKLQLELAQRAHLTVTDAQVTQAIERIATGNQLTLAQLKEKLSQQGMTYASYRKMIHKQLLIHEVQQNAIGSAVQITTKDMQNALAQYQTQMKSQQAFHVIDILAGTKKQAENIMVKLNHGANINSVAPNNTNDLGWQTANTLPQLFLQQLSSMKSGDIAGPIQAPNGFHVIKLVAVHGQNNEPTKMQLQNIAYQIKFQQAVKKWLVQLRKTAYIKVD